jgi:hypothetical protein
MIFYSRFLLFKAEIKTPLKVKDVVVEKHKKDLKDRKGKSVLDETPQEESFGPEFPETVIFASFTDLPLTKISAQTEMVDN